MVAVTPQWKEKEVTEIAHGGPETPKKGVKNRGFASMDKERLKEISGNGGRKAHEMGKAHKWSVEEATAAGKKSQAFRRATGGRRITPPHPNTPVSE